MNKCAGVGIKNDQFVHLSTCPPTGAEQLSERRDPEDYYIYVPYFSHEKLKDAFCVHVHNEITPFCTPKVQAHFMEVSRGREGDEQVSLGLELEPNEEILH